MDPSNRKWTMEALNRLREACFFYEGLSPSERAHCIQIVEDDLNFVDKSKEPLTAEEEQELRFISKLLDVDVQVQSKKQTGAGPIKNAKIDHIFQKLEKLPTQDKVIIFTQFNDSLRRLLDAFDASDIPFCEFHTHMVVNGIAFVLIILLDSQKACQRDYNLQYQ
jgi:hypothetical protein